MKLWVWKDPGSSNWLIGHSKEKCEFEWRKDFNAWGHYDGLSLDGTNITDAYLKDVLSLTDAEIRDDMLAEWEVDALWDRSVCLRCRRIRYGRDEQPQGEAAKLLLEDLAVAEERQGVRSSDVVAELCKAVTHLLRKEAEREKEE